MIAKAIANEAGFKFYNMSAGSLVSKFVGDSEKMLISLFHMARLTQPSVGAAHQIIFIDEIDSILSSRSSGEQDYVRKLKNEFLIQFDGVGTGEEEWVFLIAATNRPYDIDSAVMRRFVPSPHAAKENPGRRPGLRADQRHPQEEPLLRQVQHLRGRVRPGRQTARRLLGERRGEPREGGRDAPAARTAEHPAHESARDPPSQTRAPAQGQKVSLPLRESRRNT